MFQIKSPNVSRDLPPSTIILRRRPWIARTRDELFALSDRIEPATMYFKTQWNRTLGSDAVAAVCPLWDGILSKVRGWSSANARRWFIVILEVKLPFARTTNEPSPPPIFPPTLFVRLCCSCRIFGTLLFETTLVQNWPRTPLISRTCFCGARHIIDTFPRLARPHHVYTRLLLRNFSEKCRRKVVKWNEHCHSNRKFLFK